MEHPKVKDERGGRIIFLSHCCLNQNAKVRGIAKYPGAIRPLVEMLLEAEVGIFQMRCPEMTYVGAMRWGQVKDQYDSPMFRRHCRQIAEETLDQAEEYHRSGYEVLGFVMMDGSPVCGLNITPKSADPDTLWGGMTWYVPDVQHAPDRGVYCEVLQEEISHRPTIKDLPFVAFPEYEEAGSYEEPLKVFQSWLKGPITNKPS
jgi:predicted secreted protein